MTRQSLIAMFLLVAAAGLAVFFLATPDEEKTEPANPLAAVDFSSIQEIRCDTPAWGSWRIETRGLNRFFLSKHVAGGSAVRVNGDLYGRILGFLQDARPMGHRRSSDLDLREWGLEPPALRLTLVDSGGEHHLEAGQPDMNQEVLVRAAGSEDLFIYPARVVGDLSRDPKWFRDPRLCDIPGHRVDSIHFERPGGESFVLNRTATQWALTFPGGERRRARASTVERVVAALTALRANPARDIPDDIDPRKPELKIRIEGMGQVCEYDLVSLDADHPLALRQGEPDLRGFDANILRYIDVRAADLEDSLLIGLDRNDLGSLTILPRRGRPLKLEKKNRFWSLNFGSGLNWPVDEPAVKAFVSSLLGINTVARVPRPVGLSAAHTLEIGFTGDLELPPIRVFVSPPDGQGRRITWRSDEEGAYILDETTADVLDTHYWDLMAHYVCQAAAGRIRHISITDPDGITWDLKRSPRGSNWQLVGKKGTGVDASELKPVEFPEDFMTGLLNLLAQLNVDEFLGEWPQKKLDTTFSKPWYEIRWTYPEILVVPGSDPGAPRRIREKVFQLGTRLDDNSFFGRMSDFPALVFRFDAKRLLGVETALGHLKH